MSLSRRTWLWIAVMLALICLSVGQVVYFYPRLPETMASRFGFGGQPVGWMSKLDFCILAAAMPIGISILFAGIPVVCLKMLPGQDGDKAAGQNPATRQLAMGMLNFMFGCGVATVLLMVVIMHMAMRANLTGSPVLRYAWLAVVAYFVVLAPLVVRVAVQSHRLQRAQAPKPLPANVWFPAKQFGWGWGLPCRWQGWVFMAGWTAGLILGLVLIMRSSMPALAIPFVVVEVVILIAVCAIKGEKPRWRWGD